MDTNNRILKIKGEHQGRNHNGVFLKKELRSHPVPHHLQGEIFTPISVQSSWVSTLPPIVTVSQHDFFLGITNSKCVADKKNMIIPPPKYLGRFLKAKLRSLFSYCYHVFDCLLHSSQRRTYNSVCHNYFILLFFALSIYLSILNSMYVMLCYVIDLFSNTVSYLLKLIIYKLYGITYCMLCYV